MQTSAQVIPLLQMCATGRRQLVGRTALANCCHLPPPMSSLRRLPPPSVLTPPATPPMSCSRPLWSHSQAFVSLLSVNMWLYDYMEAEEQALREVRPLCLMKTT